MRDMLKDLHHGTRRLRRSPAFTIAAILTLSLGFAANATIFTVVERVILRSLPYPDSDRLIWIDHVAPGLDLDGGLGLSQGLYRYYGENTRSFESLAMFRSDEYTLTEDGAAERLEGVESTPLLLEALRVPPAMGRWFTEDEAQGQIRVVVISNGFWKRRFGADPNIIGRSIIIDGIAREVIGVMPASFAFPGPDVELWTPEQIDAEQVQTVGGFNYQAIARLTEGSSVATAKTELDMLIVGIKDAFPSDPVAQEALDAARLTSIAETLKDQVIGPMRQALWVLLGMVGLVLLIACANVANLFLVRAESRHREVAVRKALGAGTQKLVRYYLSESVLLSAAGGAIGLALAWAGVRMLVAFGPDNLPRLHEVTIDAGVIAFTAILTLVASGLFGAIPLMRRSGELARTLREGGRNATAGRGRFRARSMLMAGQVALALVLLVGSGLMVRSFMQLRAVDPGFDADNVLTFDVALSGTDYPDRQAANAFHDAMIERLRALPGVQTAGAVTCLPLNGSCWGDPMRVRGRSLRPGEVPPIIQIRRATPGYFETMRIPVLQGRSPQDAEEQKRNGQVLISRTFAQLYFPNEDPIGQQLSYFFTEFEAGSDVPWFTVVGVVEDTPVLELAEERPTGIVYLPLAGIGGDSGSGVHRMAFTLRSSLDPLALVTAVRGAAAAIDPNVALANVESLEMIVVRATSRMAFTMVLLVIAAGVALMLGAIGIYGVIRYIVGQRTAEIGVRMALGARPADVSGMVMRQSGSVVLAGLGIGLISALALTRLMSSLLFAVTASDPITYIAVTSFLLAIAGIAIWLPAHRAAKLDPVMALRVDQS